MTSLLLRLSDSDFPYVRVCRDETGLLLEYGRIYGTVFKSDLAETLRFDAYPELTSICDGESWHLTELYCLFDWHGHHITLKERQRRLHQAGKTDDRLPLDEPDTRQVRDYIRAFMAERGWPPSVKEICDGCFMSHGTVLRHLSLLEARGYLEREVGKIRAMRLID